MDDYEDDLAGRYFHPTKSVMTKYRALVDAGKQSEADQGWQKLFLKPARLD
jgi:hypothetical protein